MSDLEVGSFVGNTARAVTKFYMPGVHNAKNKISQGDSLTGFVAFAQQVNKLPVLQYQIQTTNKVAQNLSAGVPNILNKIDNLDEATRDPAFKYIFNPLYGRGKDGVKITEFGLFKYTLLENKMKNSEIGRSLLKMDKTLLDLKCVRNLFEKVFSNSTINIIRKKGEFLKYVDGKNGLYASKSAVVTGKALGRIPVLGLALSALFEIPNVIRGFKRGDGLCQMGRSAFNVIGYTAGAALLGAAMTVVIPPLGGFVGAAVGAWLGGKISDILGKAVFGQPKIDFKTNFFKNVPNLYYYNK